MPRDAKTLVREYIDQVLNRREPDALPDYVNYEPPQKAAIVILTRDQVFDFDLEVHVTRLIGDLDLQESRQIPLR